MSTATKRQLSRMRGGNDEPAPKRRRGRPTDYEPWMLVRAAQLGASGMIDTEICAELGIDVRTFYRWKAEREDFRQAIDSGKWLIDDRIEGSLVARALGGIKRTITTDSEGKVTTKIEELPGSDRAALALLYSRGRLKPPRSSHEIVVPVDEPQLSEEDTDVRRLALATIALLREAQDAPVLDGVSYDANEESEDEDYEDDEGEGPQLDL